LHIEVQQFSQHDADRKIPRSASLLSGVGLGELLGIADS